MPFGVLGAYTTSRRDFTSDDVQFVQAVASVLALAHRRLHLERRREQRAVLLGRLTRRERDVPRLLASGSSNRDIAVRVKIGYTTVRGHVRSVIEKLDAHSELEPVARAHRYGLVEDQTT